MEFVMPRGGARSKSGPAADPTSKESLRLGREWTVLPGFSGRVPAWPLPKASAAERAHWNRLWRKPQAGEWVRLGMQDQVALYVRAFQTAAEQGAAAAAQGVVLRMETELGLNITGLRANRWVIAPAVAAAEVAEAAPVVRPRRQTSTGNWLADVAVEGA